MVLGLNHDAILLGHFLLRFSLWLSLAGDALLILTLLLVSFLVIFFLLLLGLLRISLLLFLFLLFLRASCYGISRLLITIGCGFSGGTCRFIFRRRATSCRFLLVLFLLLLALFLLAFFLLAFFFGFFGRLSLIIIDLGECLNASSVLHKLLFGRCVIVVAPHLTLIC